MNDNFMNSIFEKSKNLVFEYGPDLIKGILILFVGWLLAKVARSLLQRILNRQKVDPSLIGFLSDLTYLVLMVFVVVTALGKIGVETNSFVAIIGAAGLAIGFALQGSLSNFAAGVLLMIFRPIKIGDFIEAGGSRGAVEKIEVFCTTLNTPDNKVITVPNASITQGNITNYSKKSQRRVDLVFGIGYDDDLQKAKSLIDDQINRNNLILKEPEPTVAVVELADSSVNIAVRPWVNTEDYWDVYFELLENIKNSFDQNGISIPFPQRDVHLYQSSQT